jgi:hypothetical protein
MEKPAWCKVFHLLLLLSLLVRLFRPSHRLCVVFTTCGTPTQDIQKSMRLQSSTLGTNTMNSSVVFELQAGEVGLASTNSSSKEMQPVTRKALPTLQLTSHTNASDPTARCVLSLSRRTLTYSFTHSFSLSRTHPHTHTLSLSLSISISISLYSPFLSLSLSFHTHTNTHTHTHTHSLSARTLLFTHALSCTRARSLSHALSFTLLVLPRRNRPLK